MTHAEEASLGSPLRDRPLASGSPEPREAPEPSLPTRPGTSNDPDGPREIENPGDPGPTVLVPPDESDPRRNPRLPEEDIPPPGV